VRPQFKSQHLVYLISNIYKDVTPIYISDNFDNGSFNNEESKRILTL
jgi:hypothetical protein